MRVAHQCKRFAQLHVLVDAGTRQKSGRCEVVRGSVPVRPV